MPYLFSDVGTDGFAVDEEHLRNSDKKGTADLLFIVTSDPLNGFEQFPGEGWSSRAVLP